jgi:DNA-binding transcriptional regulator YhcF (GntR family)
MMSKAKELAERFTKELPSWPEGRLPTGRDLAARTGASTRTVQQALDRMREQGIIESRPRAGFWRAGETPKHEYVSTRRNANDLGTQLRKELMDGIHPWESALPSIKELAVRWNCHVQTVTKALESAIHAKLLERRGRLHFPVRPRLHRRAPNPILLCVGAMASDGSLRMDSDRESDFWRELGAQASMAGVVPVRHGWSEGRITPGPNVVGVVASTWHLPDPMQVYKELSKLRVPVCVWVEEHILEGLSVESKLRFHDQGYSSEIGALVARHLLDLGHRKMAFISPWHASQWSRNRLKGLEREVVSRGGKVDAFCLGSESEWDRLIPAETDPLLVNGFPGDRLERMVEGPTGKLRDFAAAELGWNRIRRDSFPLFEQALASGATAWIGANDAVALNAVSWLRDRGIDVPGAISVVGFDDTVEALRGDLTSFRFSCAAMARSMIQQIMSPSTATVLTRHEGMVVARRTSGSVG